MRDQRGEREGVDERPEPPAGGDCVPPGGFDLAFDLPRFHPLQAHDARGVGAVKEQGPHRLIREYLDRNGPQRTVEAQVLLRPHQPVVAERAVDHEPRRARAKRPLEVHRRYLLALRQLAREVAEGVRHPGRQGFRWQRVVEHRLLVGVQVIARDVSEDLPDGPPRADVAVDFDDLKDRAERHRADDRDVHRGVDLHRVRVDPSLSLVHERELLWLIIVGVERAGS